MEIPSGYVRSSVLFYLSKPPRAVVQSLNLTVIKFCLLFVHGSSYYQTPRFSKILFSFNKSSILWVEERLEFLTTRSSVLGPDLFLLSLIRSQS